MRNKYFRILLILVILIVVIIVDFPVLSNFKESIFKRKISPVLGSRSSWRNAGCTSGSQRLQHRSGNPAGCSNYS